MVGRVMRRRQTRRTRPKVRHIEKELSRLSVGAPVKTRIPFEPPSITNSFRVTRRMVFNLYASTTATTVSFKYPTSSEAGCIILPILGKATVGPPVTPAAEFIAMQFTTVHLSIALTSSIMRSDYHNNPPTNDRGCIFDQITLDKVSFWGPTLIGLSSVLPIEIGGFNFIDVYGTASENSVIVTDSGDRNHRSHASISFPKKYWHRTTLVESTISAPIVSIQIGTNTLGDFFTKNIKDNDILGVLHISATGIASNQVDTSAYTYLTEDEEFEPSTESSRAKFSHEQRGEPLSYTNRNDSGQNYTYRGRRKN